VEELTKAILESGQLKALDRHYELTGSLSTFAIPATLQDSLMARLDRLVTAKAVAQYAAVIGRQFPYAWLQAVSQFDEATLQRELHRLIDAELVYQRGLPPQATYTFKHALIQDAAYQSLLKSTRQQYHQRIATVLEMQFPETAQTQPELLAHHCTEAGLIEQAVDYWQRAGERARERSAHAETISHLTKGIDLLTTLPETAARHRHELAMQTTLGLAFLAAKGQGAPEVERTLTRARALCHHVGDTAQLFRVLSGLRRYYFLHAELRTAHELDHQLLHLAQDTQDTAFLLEAHRMQGTTLCALGAFPAALAHLEQAYALYDRDQHRTHALLHGIDPGTVCLEWASVIFWTLGYPDQARQRMQEALRLSQSLSHAYSVAGAHAHATRLYQLCREPRMVQAQAEAAIALATEQGFPLWVTLGTVMLGWAYAKQERIAEGFVHIHQGLEVASGIGLVDWRSYFLILLAEIQGERGDVQEGVRTLEGALEFVQATGHQFFEAESYRLKGALLLQQSLDNQTEAESCFHHALDIARNQQAKSFELRTATSLARLWQQQGKRQEARDLLVPVYHWFTEGFDTADLKDAKALIEELEERR
jgi:predicted ATPase